MPPPIRLLDYVPEAIEYEVNPAYRSDPEQAEQVTEEGHPTVSIDVDWSDPEIPDGAKEEEEPDEMLFCTLTVHINDENLEETDAYYVNLRLAGLFQRTAPENLFEAEQEGENYLLHTLSSCISMLYSTARSEIASMTSQTPYGKFLLPSISPMQAAESVIEDNNDDSLEEEETEEEA